ncbi:unnamed protein product [Orchesella dallaii]
MNWCVIGVIAIIIGILASVMKLVVEKFQIFYFPFITKLIMEGSVAQLWIYYPLLGATFSVLSATVIVYICPFAAGSGLPEIIGILNGCVVRNVLNFRTLACKIISCIFTVISTLPVGFEGPMVHIGALVGACMAQPLRCRCCVQNKKEHFDEKQSLQKSCFPNICRYRDCRERYSLICVGAAAGVAAAFSSPIAGLTFAMEEMSSHWSKTLTWQAFVCCILARSTAELFHSFLEAAETMDEHEGSYLMYLSESALFDMRHVLNLNIAVLLPATIIGLFGGVVGSIFIFSWLKLSKFKRRMLAHIQHPKLVNVVKIFEVLLVSLLSCTAVLLSMQLATCKPVNHSQKLHVSTLSSKHFRLRSFQCDNALNVSVHEGVLSQTGEFHEGASLLFGSWEQMIRNLFSRRTAGYFNVPLLTYVFGYFLIFATWSSCTSIASGLLIPQLAIGALFGRGLGQLVFDVFEISDSESGKFDWIDPGALALLGAASFLSGTSRLPVTSVIMMIEMTNDINLSVLIMLCVMLSKFSGDLMTHSLDHSMLDFKCIPYLEAELKIYNEGTKINLELFRAEDVMKSPVRYVGVKENVYTLANLLLDTNHGGFPVVQVGFGFLRTFLGVITRLELTKILTKTKKFDASELVGEDIDMIRISYPEYSSGKLKDIETVNSVLNNYSTQIKYRNVHVNLLPYINTSAISVPRDFSLYRAYMMFRGLGLRHMVVVDRYNQVEGVITRKDLLGYTVETKLMNVLNNNDRKGFYIGSPTTSESSSATASTSTSGSPSSANSIFEVIHRQDSMTSQPQGLQSTVILEEAEEEEA